MDHNSTENSRHFILYQEISYNNDTIFKEHLDIMYHYVSFLST